MSDSCPCCVVLGESQLSVHANKLIRIWELPLLLCRAFCVDCSTDSWNCWANFSAVKLSQGLVFPLTPAALSLVNSGCRILLNRLELLPGMGSLTLSLSDNTAGKWGSFGLRGLGRESVGGGGPDTQGEGLGGRPFTSSSDWTGDGDNWSAKMKSETLHKNLLLAY